MRITLAAGQVLGCVVVSNIFQKQTTDRTVFRAVFRTATQTRRVESRCYNLLSLSDMLLRTFVLYQVHKSADRSQRNLPVKTARNSCACQARQAQDSKQSKATKHRRQIRPLGRPQRCISNCRVARSHEWILAVASVEIPSSECYCQQRESFFT